MGFRSFKLPKERVGIFQSQLHSHPATGYRDTCAAIEKNRFSRHEKKRSRPINRCQNVECVSRGGDLGYEGGRFRGQDSLSITTCNHVRRADSRLKIRRVYTALTKFLARGGVRPTRSNTEKRTYRTPLRTEEIVKNDFSRETLRKSTNYPSPSSFGELEECFAKEGGTIIIKYSPVSFERGKNKGDGRSLFRLRRKRCFVRPRRP